MRHFPIEFINPLNASLAKPNPLFIMQVTVISGLFAVFFYLMGSVFQTMNFRSNKDTRSQVFTFGGLAVLAHALSAYGVILRTDGFHFGLFEITTLITLSISLSVLISSLRKPLQILFLGLFPLAAISIVASLVIRSDYPPTNMSLTLASHVLISILSYSFITIATAFLFFDDIWGADGVIHKTVFSLLAWIVFAVLLWGRHQLGWRGQTAIRGTLSGFALLIIGFYGVKFALEYLII